MKLGIFAAAVALAVLALVDPALAGTVSGGQATGGGGGGVSADQSVNNALNLVLSVGGVVLLILFVFWMLSAAGSRNFRAAAEAFALFILTGAAVFEPHQAKQLVENIVQQVL